MKASNLTICNETIHPGEDISLALPLPELFSCAPMYMPIKVIHGKEAGPCLLLTAAMHGNEINGTAIINKLLEVPAIKRLKGTVIAVPILNVYAFINKARTMPGGVMLNQSFPGSEHGTYASRTAYLFNQEILNLADYSIDLQTGFVNHSNLPQIFINPDNEEQLALAEAFSAPVISSIKTDAGSLREAADKRNIPHIVYEAGEALRFDEQAIKTGVRGILNVMQHLNMITAKTKKLGSPSFQVKGTRWVRASNSGMHHSKLKLGQEVKKGQKTSVIKDPFSAGEDRDVIAPFSGVVVSINKLPLVREGETLFKIAVFEEMELATTHFEDWQPNTTIPNHTAE
tara:strand:- start:160136 stop:161164 length:1029 start_codon:yes stop_codon:yes gene_type:complete